MTLYPKANIWKGGTGTGDELEIGASLASSTVSTERRRKPHEPSGRLTGRVTRYSISRSFGFINIGGRDGDDYFFHRTSLPAGIDFVMNGETVQFDLGEGRDGRPIAKNITLI